jgi:transcriptional regulator with XRE-family HTH domain
MASSCAERLRSRRLELGLSQRDIAEPGVSNAYISRIEAGARNPSARALRKLAPKLGVSVEWLETGQEPTRFSRLAPDDLNFLEEALRPFEETEQGRRLLKELQRERSRRW